MEKNHCNAITQKVLFQGCPLNFIPLLPDN